MARLVPMIAAVMLIVTASGLAQAQPAAAPATSDDEQPVVIREVLACRAIEEAVARLNCFDTQTARFDEAVRTGEVVTADREEVRRTNRSLFGLQLPRIRIFGSDDDEVTEIQGEIRSLGQNQDGKVIVTLTDDARWVQTDNRPVIGVRVGMQVTIRRAALGSFFLQFPNGASVRARRIN